VKIKKVVKEILMERDSSKENVSIDRDWGSRKGESWIKLSPQENSSRKSNQCTKKRIKKLISAPKKRKCPEKPPRKKNGAERSGRAMVKTA